MGKLRLSKSCQNKHFSTASMIKSKFKRKKIFLLPKYYSFQPLSWLIKISFSFSLPQIFSCQLCNFVVFSSSNFLAGDLQCCSFEINTQFLWHSSFAILKLAITHEIRRQMLVYFETSENVIQSRPVTDFSFGFTEGSFFLLNGQNT